MHGTTPSPHRQGANMITTSICQDLHTHRDTYRCASFPDKENIQSGVWIKRRQPPRKILKKFNQVLTRLLNFLLILIETIILI